LQRLHLTVPVIFMEISGQTRQLLPIMLACKMGALVADWLHPHSLFHSIIDFKGLTFLNAEADPAQVT
jgi:H+/Cl- antiporter ClcA